MSKLQVVAWVNGDELDNAVDRDVGISAWSVRNGWFGTALVRFSDADRVIGQLCDEVEDRDNWRNLALQFDRHRIDALAHLKAITRGEDGAIEACRAFLAAAPVAGSDIAKEHDEIRAEVEALRNSLRTEVEAGDSWKREAEELRDEVEALRKDAERYRWLRDKGLHREIFADSAAVAPGLGPFIMIQFPSSGAPNRVQLGSGADAYVDAAMAAKEGV